VATDFFERQRRARQHSLWLRIGFALALALASVLNAAGLVLLVACLSLGAILEDGGQGALAAAFIHTWIGWYVAAGMLAFSLAVSALKAWRLRDGGSALARMLHARPVSRESGDPRHRQFLNIVAEMSLASQVPEPEAWVLEGEPAINAFAAGRTLEGAVIGVTSGALEQLDRGELQAIVAHEFSHVLNGDMALNTRLVAWLAGLFAIADLAEMLKGDRQAAPSSGRVLFWWARLGVHLFHAAGCIGLFIGRALQAAISRRREELADASAVQFTRNAGALKSALLKIEAATGAGIRMRTPAGMAHLLFASGDARAGGWLERLRESFLETHPRMLDRVQALDRGLSEAQYRAAVRIVRKRQLAERERAAAPVQLGDEVLQPVSRPPPRDPVDDFLCSRLNAAQQRAVIAQQRQIGSSAEDLQALIVAALLDPDPARAQLQRVQLLPLLGAPVIGRVDLLRTRLQELPAIARLTLICSLLPTLQALPDRSRLRMVKVARAFRSRVLPEDTLRFAVARLVLHGLVHVEKAPAAPGGHPASLADCAEAVGVVCSLLARASGALAAKAYEAGIEGLVPPLRRPMLQDGQIDAATVDAALDALSGLAFAARASVCQGLLRVVAANGTMSAAEFDLLRLVSLRIGMATPATGAIRLESAALQSA
jgi:Zn-dependent protease with chaperone function